MTAEAGCERRGKQDVRRNRLAMGGGGEGEDEVGCGSDVECVGERASGAMEHVGRGIDDDSVRELDREGEILGRNSERGSRGDGGHGRAEDECRWRGSGEIQIGGVGSSRVAV